MSLLDRVMAKTQAFDFSALWTGLKDAWRPHDERIAKVKRAHGAWFQRELANPSANVTTETPNEVTEAIAKATYARSAAGCTFGEASQPAIRAEEERLLAEALPVLERAGAVMDGLHEFDAQRRRFAQAAGLPIPEAIADDTLTSASVRFWRIRALARLNPATRPIVKAADNPLVLD